MKRLFNLIESAGYLGLGVGLLLTNISCQLSAPEPDRKGGNLDSGVWASPGDPRGDDAGVDSGLLPDASTVVGPKGGVIRIDEVKITVPKGALEKEQTLSVIRLDAEAPASYETCSPLYEFRPKGLELDKPISISLTVECELSNIQVYWQSEGETGFRLLDSRIIGQTITVHVTDLGTAFIGRQVDCDPDINPCEKGYECIQGTCIPSSCPEGESFCSGQCRDLSRDSAHCGFCGQACSSDQRCVASLCQDQFCPQHRCEGFSYCDEDSGACLSGCCTDGQCPENEECDRKNSHKCRCRSGYHRCEGSCVNDESVNHCGDLCDPCPSSESDHTVAVCQEGSCQTICAEGYHDCQDNCVWDESPQSCGDRCEPCASDPHGTAVCEKGLCTIRCDSGYNGCAGTCVPCPDHTQTAGCREDNRCIALQCEKGYELCEEGCCRAANSEMKIEWIRYIVGPGDDIINDVAVDDANNIYISGEFEKNAFPDSDSYFLCGAELYAGNVLSSYDSKGRQRWTVSKQSTGLDDAGGTITMDSLYNLYVIFKTGIASYDRDGAFRWRLVNSDVGIESIDNIYLDPVDNVYIKNDNFIGSYDGSGSPRWSIELENGASISDIAFDSNNNLYIAGGFEGPVDFGDGPITAVYSDIFILCYSSTGRYLWSRTFSSTDIDTLNESSYFSEKAHSIAIDDQGNVIVSGYCSGPIEFAGEPPNRNGLFITSFSQLGLPLWSQFIDISTLVLDPFDIDARDYSVNKGVIQKIDEYGNIYITGVLGVEPTDPEFYSPLGCVAASGDYTCSIGFIASYTSEGINRWLTYFRNAIAMSGDSLQPPGGPGVGDSYFLTSRDFYLVGTFVETLYLSERTLTTPAGQERGWIAAFDHNNGHVRWAERIGSLVSYCSRYDCCHIGSSGRFGCPFTMMMFPSDPVWATGIATQNDEVTFVTGVFTGTADLGEGPVNTIDLSMRYSMRNQQPDMVSPQYYSDAYIIKYAIEDSDSDTGSPDEDSGTIELPCEPDCPDVNWVPIEGGTFLLGGSHEVTVPSFIISKSEVTVSQYSECVDSGFCSEPHGGSEPFENWCNWDKPGRENYPVNGISWDQARKFCEWVGGRLPSEAEWEYAARSRGGNYPWGEDQATCEYIEYCGCGELSDLINICTHAVCSRPLDMTDQGLCDMAGNAWEWVEDDYHNSYEGAPVDGSAWIDEPYEDPGTTMPDLPGFTWPRGYVRVVRRSLWHDGNCLATRMGTSGQTRSIYPGNRYDGYGFRVVQN